MSDNPLAEVHAALEPFAKEADRYDPDEGDDEQIAWYSGGTITYGMLRRARDALAALSHIESHNALADGDVLQNDLRDLLYVLGMPSGAQPRSPHEVFRDALMRMKLIRADALEEAAKVAEEEGSDYDSCLEIAAAIRALISPSPSPPDDSA